MKTLFKYAPVILLTALGLFLVKGLFQDNPDNLPSPLVEKPVPSFELETLLDPDIKLSDAVLREPGVKVVNIWASWCGPCRLEHDDLMTLAEQGVPIYGINYKDDAEKAKAFLEELGNPFTMVGFDRTGRIGIDWGVYGVPETFIINSQGVITYKHIGPIQNDDLTAIILPEIEKASLEK